MCSKSGLEEKQEKVGKDETWLPWTDKWAEKTCTFCRLRITKETVWKNLLEVLLLFTDGNYFYTVIQFFYKIIKKDEFVVSPYMCIACEVIFIQFNAKNPEPTKLKIAWKVDNLSELNEGLFLLWNKPSGLYKVPTFSKNIILNKYCIIYKYKLTHNLSELASGYQ